MSAWQEKAVAFGPDRGLVGIATLPATPKTGAPFVLLLNAGLMHRAGPFRMSVELARDLASRGYGVLRFDLSSLGDSPARPGAPTPDEAAVADCKDAMTTASERWGATRFVVMGLCTGAMNSHRAALADERVVGMCLFDGYAYKTLSADIARVARHLDSPEAVASSVKSLFRRAARALGQEAAPSSRPSSPPDERIGIFYQEWPPAAVVHGELERILGRGARALFLYTGGWDGFVHARQFDEMFPGLRHRERASVHYFAEADHTYLIREHRELLKREVRVFLEGL